MSRFLKFIPSEEAMYLVRKHLKAFGLLTIIAERARRENGHPDGLTIGQCHLGDYKSYGLTEKEYRNAKKILVERGLIKIVETCRTRKSEKNTKKTLILKNHKKGANERATRSTTYGTLVELCSTTIYDINSDSDNHQKGDRKGDRGATEGRGTRKKKKEEEDHPSIPSFALTDDFSLEQEIEVIPGVSMRKNDLEACLKLKGDMEKVKEALAFIQQSKKRKFPITDWPTALANWKIEDETKVKIKKNILYADNLCREFREYDQGRGWRCCISNDSKRDIRGLLFENQSGYQDVFFVPLSDGEMKDKCERFIEEKNMRNNKKTFAKRVNY